MRKNNSFLRLANPREVYHDITQNIYHVGANMKETKEFNYYKNWVQLPYVGFGPSILERREEKQIELLVENFIMYLGDYSLTPKFHMNFLF